jgi:tripartite-type tricarboxylate transporter receptor subunit TctC
VKRRGLAPTRRRGLLASVLATPALAQQGWPDRPIRLINPWTPGGPADLVARPLAQHLTETLGKPVVMENRAGANGTIATGLVARAAPDGYTLLFGHAGPNTISPVFQANVGFDPVKDFAPVTQLVSSPLVLVCRLGLAARSIAELVALAKGSVQPLSYGSVGPASTTHLAGEMLARASGTRMLHVPYTGAAAPIIDLLAERIDMAFLNAGAVMQHIRAGRLRPLAVSTLRPNIALPELPTLAETFPGFEVNSWYGILVPAAAPGWMVERYYQAFRDALLTPEITRLMNDNGLDVEATTPAAFTARIASDIAKWRELQRVTGIRVE